MNVDTITQSTFKDGVHYAATMSMEPNASYRYVLERDWSNPEGPQVTPETDLLVWVMLNPSTADGMQDDPTIRRCMAFARAWGYGGIAVVNLYAWRATDPDELFQMKDVVGPLNLDFVERACRGRHVVVAWGAHAVVKQQWEDVGRTLERIRKGAVRIDCLGTTKSGHPRHPLYVKGTTPREPWRAECSPD